MLCIELLSCYFSLDIIYKRFICANHSSWTIISLLNNYLLISKLVWFPIMILGVRERKWKSFISRVGIWISEINFLDQHATPAYMGIGWSRGSLFSPKAIRRGGGGLPPWSRKWDTSPENDNRKTHKYGIYTTNFGPFGGNTLSLTTKAQTLLPLALLPPRWHTVPMFALWPLAANSNPPSAPKLATIIGQLHWRTQKNCSGGGSQGLAPGSVWQGLRRRDSPWVVARNEKMCESSEEKGTLSFFPNFSEFSLFFEIR